MIQGRPPLTVLFNFFSDSMTTEQAQKQQDESDRQRLLFAMTPTPITTSLYTQILNNGTDPIQSCWLPRERHFSQSTRVDLYPVCLLYLRFYILAFWVSCVRVYIKNY